MLDPFLFGFHYRSSAGAPQSRGGINSDFLMFPLVSLRTSVVSVITVGWSSVAIFIFFGGGEMRHLEMTSLTTSRISLLVISFSPRLTNSSKVRSRTVNFTPLAVMTLFLANPAILLMRKYKTYKEPKNRF